VVRQNLMLRLRGDGTTSLLNTDGTVLMSSSCDPMPAGRSRSNHQETVHATAKQDGISAGVPRESGKH